VKQICQRNGYYATFMCRPRIPNVVSSGWHLHQPLVHVADDTNAFMPTEPGAPLSLTGQRYLAGLLFPGGASNVEAHRYGGQASTGMLVDPDRDHVALALMQAAAARGLPMLAICRGFQEMNVAFGGTLHADIHACGHSGDHLEDPSEDLVTRYRYRHEVELTPGGILSALAGAQRVRVNSLHRQGVASLAPHLVVEARTPDGLIEASRLDGHAFAVGVQWHPEVMVDQDVLSRALFEAFGANCERYLREAATPE
jgi:putative glutamine amidotransferase